MEHNEPTRHPGADPSKQIKVKLPVQLIIRLQEIRILKGRTAGEVVKTALEEYFQRLQGEKSERKDD